MDVVLVLAATNVVLLLVAAGAQVTRARYAVLAYRLQERRDRERWRRARSRRNTPTHSAAHWRGW